MELKDIEKKIADFYEGTTSAKDEKMLYDYFLTATDLPKHLEIERKLFLELYEQESNIEVPANLENKIDSLIDRLAEEEKENTVPKIVSLNAPQRKTFSWKWVATTAACIAVLITGALYLMPPQQVDQSNLANNNDDSQEMVDTFTDPKEASIATQKALLLASSKLNKAFSQLETAQESISKINKQ